jgi:hypothetical protein
MKIFRYLLPLPLIVSLSGCGGGGGGGTTVTPPPPPTKAKWTILVYLNASNDLFPDGDVNVGQMEKAATNAQVNIIVQWKQSKALFPAASFDGTRRYQIISNASSPTQNKLIQDLGAGIDMGNPQTLQQFIAWGKTNYPADRTELILWDHGNGWRTKQQQLRPKGRAFSYDFATGNAIQIWDLKTALAGNTFDTIVFDCSLMQMVEVAYELKPFTQYVVASEESPPAAGYPYDQALGRYRDNPTGTTLTLAESFVDTMLLVPSYVTSPIEESVIDTSKLPAVSTAVDQLAAQLITFNGALATTTQNIRANAQQYDTTVTPPRYFFDLFDVAQHYQSMAPQAAVQTAAAAVKTAVQGAVVYEKHNSNSLNSHGLSIDFSPSVGFLPAQGQYNQLDFAAANRWEQWLAFAP